LRSSHCAQDDNSYGDDAIVTLDDIRDAQARLRGIAVRTKPVESHIHQTDGAADNRRLFLKPENQQPIGAFKLRGHTTRLRLLLRKNAGAA